MDSRFLESLVQVVDQGSIVAAARVQSLTPAAVSLRIQVLETEFGAPLLIRGANTITPSRLCLDLLPRVRRIVADCHRLRHSANPGQAEGTLRVGAISTMLTGVIPDALRRLRDSAPDLQLQISPGTSAALYEALRSGSLDAALIVAPPFDVPDGISLHPVASEDLCILVPPDCPLTDSHEILRTLPLIEYDPAAWGGYNGARYLAAHRIAAQRICTLDGLEAISDLVASGVGASLVPRWHGVPHARALPDGDAYARHLVCAVATCSERPGCDRAFLDCLT